MSLFWIVGTPLALIGIVIIFALITIASDEGDVADERDCRATLDRSNGLSGKGEE